MKVRYFYDGILVIDVSEPAVAFIVSVENATLLRNG